MLALVLWSILASLASLSHCAGPLLYSLGLLSSALFTDIAGSCFQWKTSDKPTVHQTADKSASSWWTQWSLQQLKSSMFPSGDDTEKEKQQVSIGLTFNRWIQTSLQMNANVAHHIIFKGDHMSMLCLQFVLMPPKLPKSCECSFKCCFSVLWASQYKNKYFICGWREKSSNHIKTKLSAWLCTTWSSWEDVLWVNRPFKKPK